MSTIALAFIEEVCNSHLNNNENVHRFALSAIQGEVLERERKIEREREKKR